MNISNDNGSDNHRTSDINDPVQSGDMGQKSVN